MAEVKAGIFNGGRGSGQTVRRITAIYEEKIADLKANFDYVLEGKDLKIKLLGERCNQLLKDKGDLTDELAQWKEEWQEQVQKAIDEGWERTKLTGRVRELEQQIDKLQEQNSQMFNTIALQEQQIEKMKRYMKCENCVHYKEHLKAIAEGKNGSAWCMLECNASHSCFELKE